MVTFHFLQANGKLKLKDFVNFMRKKRMKVTRAKNCFCHTCDKAFHYLGINRHRAMHREKFEDCTITYTYGDKYTFKYSERKKYGKQWKMDHHASFEPLHVVRRKQRLHLRDGDAIERGEPF